MVGTITFHREVYLPKLKLPEGELQLSYTQHALDEAYSDQVETLPRAIKTSEVEVVEVTTDRKLKPTKLLCRMALGSGRDICFVVLITLVGYTVLTTWTNRSNDRHATLDRSRYVPAP